MFPYVIIHARLPRGGDARKGPETPKQSAKIMLIFLKNE